jgi:hypothetical protein
MGYLILVMMAIIKKQKIIRVCEGYGEKGVLCTLLVGMEVGSGTMENCMKDL